jgi:hypothetical protein
LAICDQTHPGDGLGTPRHLGAHDASRALSATPELSRLSARLRKVRDPTSSPRMPEEPVGRDLAPTPASPGSSISDRQGIRPRGEVPGLGVRGHPHTHPPEVLPNSTDSSPRRRTHRNGDRPALILPLWLEHVRSPRERPDGSGQVPAYGWTHRANELTRPRQTATIDPLDRDHVPPSHSQDGARHGDAPVEGSSCAGVKPLGAFM